LWGALICLRAEKTPIEPDLDHTSVGKYARIVVSDQLQKVYSKRNLLTVKWRLKTDIYQSRFFLVLPRLRIEPLADGHVSHIQNGRWLFFVKEQIPMLINVLEE